MQHPSRVQQYFYFYSVPTDQLQHLAQAQKQLVQSSVGVVHSGGGGGQVACVPGTSSL